MFAIEGGASRELLTYGGRVIVHDNRRELEFLFPKYRDGQVRFVELEPEEGGKLKDGRPTMALRDHPDMDTVRWPLREEDFVQLTGQTRRQEAEIIAAQLQRAGQEHDQRARRSRA
jgi:hypothetical protein